MKRVLFIPKNWWYGYGSGVQYLGDAIKKLGAAVLVGVPNDVMDPVDIIIDTDYPGITSEEEINKWKKYAPVYLSTDFESYPLPKEFLDALSKYDGVIVHSEYEKYTYIASGATPEQMAKVTVVPFPVAYDLPNITKETYRENLNIDKGVFTIGVIGSPSIRKGFVEDYIAYINAFADNMDLFSKEVVLVYRPTPYPQFVETGKQIFSMIKALKTQSKSTLNVKIISDTNFNTVKFYNTLNAVLSLHHAEGFGLHLAEASILGKQLIATAYSGNVDFMSNTSSYLVPAVTAFNIDPYFSYNPTQIWSDPILVAAATELREAYNDFKNGTPKLNKEYYLEFYKKALDTVQTFLNNNTTRSVKPTTNDNTAKVKDRLIEV
jgi:glycosyltransferase involved in cell wall biosynthesis